MPLPQNQRLFLLFVVLVVLAGMAGLRWPVPSSPSPAPRPADASEPVELPEVVEKGPSLPLPPPGQPLSEIAATLQQRADAGDRAAACRLGVELLACEHMERRGDILRTHLELLEHGQAREGQLERADSAAQAQLDMLEGAEQCDLRDPALDGAGFRYLRQAALAGDRDAVLIYVSGAVFNDFSHLQDTRFDTWRREVPALMQRELRRGNTDVVWQLMIAHDGDHDAATGLIPDDPILGAAYAHLYRTLGDDPAPDDARTLDEAQLAKATSLSRRWHQEYFDGRTYPREGGLSNRGLVPLVLLNPQLGKKLSVCDPAPQRAGDEVASPARTQESRSGPPP